MLAGRGWGKCSEEELWRGERWGSGAPVGGKEEGKLRERRTGVTEADCDSGRGRGGKTVEAETSLARAEILREPVPSPLQVMEE